MGWDKEAGDLGIKDQIDQDSGDDDKIQGKTEQRVDNNLWSCLGSKSC